MTKLEDAMLKHIQNIVYNEYRPFSFMDLLNFEVDGLSYNPSHGTIRNKFSKFSKEEKIELCYIDTIAFYSLPGKRFGKDRLMTRDHTEVNTQKLIRHPLYNILESTTFGERTIHNFHSCFNTRGIYTYLSNNHKLNIEPIEKSKGLFFKYCDIDQFIVIITIYPNDSCTVVIGCSENPVSLDFEGINKFSIALSRIEERLSQLLINSIVKIPSYKDWTITLWHIGKDSLSEYSKEMFHCKWDLAEKMIVRIYSKELQIGKKKVRIEVQQNPNISVEELKNTIMKKILE